jgi:proline iminopeptidase
MRGSDEMAVESGEFVEIDGIAQWVTIRGADARNPVLLIIGGPGSCYAAFAPFFAEWEREFTLVQWDQPGAGFTFGKTGVEPRTIERLVSDGLVVAEFVRSRLRVSRVALMCLSAGTIVGLTMARRRPEIFSGYVANGQVVCWAEQEALGYRLLLERAQSDSPMRAELEALGPPPYADAAADVVKSKYAAAPTPRELRGMAPFMAAAAAALTGQPQGATYFAAGVTWPEPRARSLSVYTALRAEIVSFDAVRLGTRFAIPLFFLQGEDDLYTVTAEVARYAQRLQAPRVEFAAIEGAGHFTLLLRDELLAFLRTRVRERLLR